MPLLEVTGLSISYYLASGVVRAVRELSLKIEPGESIALVGESGSGKSTAALALIGLLESNARAEAGDFKFEDTPLRFEDPRPWRRLRGSKIGMVFQDARGALNPVMTVGAQLMDVLQAHQQLSRRKVREKAVALLAEAGIPDPGFCLRRYPVELSGGLCQRVAIAIAICNRPRLLIADEPTSALDPSIQAQILDLLRNMKNRHRLALLLISHDLALVAEMSDRVAVMYHGSIVESGAASEIFQRPAHPYTASLIECQTDLNHRWDRRPLAAIAGSPPAGEQEFTGCAFAPRCPKADADCAKCMPPAASLSSSHWAACFKPD
jgi:oligopeptide/dipeptide ABC transporter ATP-binding protein